MIALDTNVLVRFVVEDDLEQSRRAKDFLRKNIRKRVRFYISDLVLCETVWVLSRAYGFTRPEICNALRQLVSARELVFASPERTHGAIDSCEQGRGDFSDYMILEEALSAGCTAVATFDKGLLRERGFVAP